MTIVRPVELLAAELLLGAEPLSGELGATLGAQATTTLRSKHRTIPRATMFPPTQTADNDGSERHCFVK